MVLMEQFDYIKAKINNKHMLLKLCILEIKMKKKHKNKKFSVIKS